VRADGASNWGTIWLPLVEFTHYAAALTGQKVTVPGNLAIRQMGQQQSKDLHELHAAATKSKPNPSDTMLEADAIHGLEQQLIHALISCLGTDAIDIAASSPPALIELAVRFEEFVLTERNKDLRVPQICRALGVTAKLLEQSCASQLGMGPSAYLQLCRRPNARPRFRVGIDRRLGTP
jgi:hypothetical protein